MAAVAAKPVEGLQERRPSVPHSPERVGRLVGLLYLLLAVVGPFSLVFAPSQILVPGDAAATASNLGTSESLFRAGLLGEAFIFLIEVPLVVLLHWLFAPVNRIMSMVAGVARGAMAVLQGVNVAVGLGVLLVVSGAGYLEAFSPDQLSALTLVVLKSRGAVAHVWASFFALHCTVLAWLIYRSAFLPRILGPLMAVAALGYLANGPGSIVLPEQAGVFAVLAGVGALVGEIPFMLWLLIRGVDGQAWRSRAER